MNKKNKNDGVKSTDEDTTVASVAMPPTRMPKALLRRRKEPRVEETVVVDRRYKESKTGRPTLRRRFRRHVKD